MRQRQQEGIDDAGDDTIGNGGIRGIFKESSGSVNFIKCNIDG
jgi:hypothetical protein